MYSIKNNRISLTRGDSFIAHISMTRNGEAYIPTAEDSIRFAMKRNYSEAEPLLIKNIPSNTQILQLDPEDTRSLPFGKYVYDIEITFENGVVDTFILGTITLTEEVY